MALFSRNGDKGYIAAERIDNMELSKYIQDKIKQQNEACFKAGKLEREIDNWRDKSGIDI